MMASVNIFGFSLLFMTTFLTYYCEIPFVSHDFTSAVFLSGIAADGGIEV